MESWLRLSREQTRLKIARQKRQRYLFWSIGLVLVAVQVTMAIRASRSTPTALSQSFALAGDAGELHRTTATVTPPAYIVKATAAYTMAPALHTPLPTASLTPADHPPAQATAVDLAALASPQAERVTMQTPTPSAPTSTIQPARTGSGTFQSTGYGMRRETPEPTRSSSSLVLLAPPEQVTEQTFELSGTGQPGKEVFIIYNHSIIAQAQIDQHGDWRTAISTSPLVRGDNVFVLTTSGTDTSVIETSNASGVPPDRGEDNQLVFFRTTFAPWWLDAPLRLQASLGEGYACAPTVLGAAMDFYHQSNAGYPAPATVELVRALTNKGFISGYGADAQMVCDLAIAYGYSHSFFYQEWSQAHLRHMLDAGHPVIANVRVGLSTDGYGHSVLVIGLSRDGQRVMLIDPVQGMVEASWTQFDRSWASFGPPYRHGTVVMP